MKTAIIILVALGPASCQTNTVDYQTVVNRLEERRQAIAFKSTEMSEEQLTNSCSSLLFTTLVDSVFPAWYGTPWDFNGTSNSPCEGEIACGYFVSTTLRHAGFNLNRYKLAQQAAETIVKELCGNDFVTKHSSLDHLLETINGKDHALYVVGLNYHVGFIAVSEHEIYFIHSDYFSGQVKSENAADSYAMQTSSIFVLGEVTNNNELIKSWLTGRRLY